MPSDYAEKRLSGKTVFTGKVFSVELDDVQLPDGRPSTREVIRHPGGVAVLALDEADHVFLVRQYRYAAGRTLLEIPAGRLEEGEPPELAAARELSEETGLRCACMRSLGVMLPTPGYDTECIYLYLATDLEPGEPHPDEGEFVELVSMPLAEVERMAAEGRLVDAKTLAALYRLRLMRG